MHTHLTLWSQSGPTVLSRHCMGIYQKKSSKATCQGMFVHSCLSSLSHCALILAYWGSGVCKLIFKKTFKKKTCGKWLFEAPRKILGCEKKTTHCKSPVQASKTPTPKITRFVTLHSKVPAPFCAYWHFKSKCYSQCMPTHDVAQLVERQTSMPLMQVWFPDAADSLMESIHPHMQSHTLTSMRTLKIL